MTYQGVVRNGKIELEDGAELGEGTVVRVEPVACDRDPTDLIGDEAVSTDLPDLAAQHDHYLYGTPKRED